MTHKPSTKAPAIVNLLNALSGDNREQQFKEQRCVIAPIGCGKPITPFRDMLSEKEYSISGLCQECQDSIFKEID